MKTFTRIYIMIFITTAFISMVGCSQVFTPNLNNENQTNADEIRIDESQLKNTDSTVQEISVPYSGLDIEINNIGMKTDFKEEIIKQIITARTIDEKVEQENYQYYADNKLWNMTEFYFPTNKIDGYELCGVVLSEDLLRFYYSPIDEINEEEYLFNYSTGIRVSIQRMDDTFASAPLKPILEQYEEQGFDYKYENNLIFNDTLKSVNGQIGESRFRFTINVPDELYSLEFLKKLSDKILQTSELVILDKNVDLNDAINN